MSSPAKKVLLIEDHPPTRDIAHIALTSEGHRVIESESVKLGLALFQSEEPDLVILDLHLTDGDGMQVCRHIRAHKTRADTPLIILTGESEPDIKKLGFDAGADAYLIKPISPEELTLWVRALFRRRTLDLRDGDLVEAGDLSIDAAAQLVRYKGSPIADITGKEFDLLLHLVRSRPRILSRQYMLTKVWKTVAVDNLVNVHLSNLRKKLPVEISDRIQSVPGKGYRYFG